MEKIKNILKNKIVLVVSIIVLFIILIFLTIYFMLNSSLRLNGNSIVDINYTEEYKEEGASVKLFGKDLSSSIKINSNVKNGELGNYKVTYTVKLLIFNISKVRLVNIIDNVPPKITLKGENKVSICPNKEYSEEGYEAIDDHDGNLTDKVSVNVSDSQITYEVSDSYGNKEKVIREILKEDTEAPAIKVKGSLSTYVRKGTKYNDAGYDVTDNCDEKVIVNVTNNVDTNKDGKYKVIYEAIDSSGNKVKLERNVVVYTDNKIGVVYLTFDDGPSGTGSTEKILNVLKEEGVKATFFVTGKGPDSLIKREFNEGHTIALHTNTHDYYTLYKSVDAYYKDLNAVRNRVYNITGEYSNIIRFPGGSNNTVSITASGYRIMDTLTKDVVDKGYTYFDWNITSGDAGECVTSSCVYNNVINSLSKRRNNVILMHDIKMFTANALKDIITYCKQNGYVFEVITEETYPVRFK